MRDLREGDIDLYRERGPQVRKIYGTIGGSTEGVFRVPCGSEFLLVIASVGGGWDHVSVSHPTRVPTWDEMERIKRLFFRADETAMQLHVPPAEHINRCGNCLHLWRPLDAQIPRPPAAFVG